MLAGIRPDLDLTAIGERPAFEAVKQQQYDRLADHFRAHVDVERLVRDCP